LPFSDFSSAISTVKWYTGTGLFSIQDLPLSCGFV